ncbi:MAG: LD-carboxypeptidase [Lentisphaeria bacterium]|nr:LD-carboxypeptidase [Lentisphaeria bacterium]
MAPGALPNPFPPSVRRVGVFSPAGIPEPERLARGIALLESWGLTVVAPPAPAPCRFLAGDDRGRAEVLNGLLRDERVDVLMAARGGYGCGRILGLVDWEAARRRKVGIIGYSDVTALHAAAYAAGSSGCIAGPMVSSTFGRDLASSEEEAGMRAALASLAVALAHGGRPGTQAPEERLSEASPSSRPRTRPRGAGIADSRDGTGRGLGSRDAAPEAPERSRSCRVSGASCLEPLRQGTVTGPLFPANLAVLASLAGTAHWPDLRGAVLVLEDIHEAAYRVDRCLNQLDAVGCLGTVGGLVFGQFTDAEDAQWLPEVFADFAGRVRGPVAAGLGFGHVFPSLSLPVGCMARLDVGAEGGVLSVC